MLNEITRIMPERDVINLPIYEQRNGTAVDYQTRGRDIALIKNGDYVWLGDEPDSMLDFHEIWEDGYVGQYLTLNYSYVIYEWDNATGLQEFILVA